MGDVSLAFRSCGMLRHIAVKTKQHAALRGDGFGVNATKVCSTKCIIVLTSAVRFTQCNHAQSEYKHSLTFRVRHYTYLQRIML